jgi:hypothetical protein
MNDVIYMTCENEKCEYRPTLNRKVDLARDQVRYAQLWAEIELPKQLGEKRQ